MGLRARLLLPLLLLGALLGGYLYYRWIPQNIAEREALQVRSVERHLDSVAEALIPLLLNRELDTVHGIMAELFKRNADWRMIRLEDAGGRLLYPLPGMAQPLPGSNDVRNVTRTVGYMGMDLGRIGVSLDMTPIRRDLEARHRELATMLLGILAAITLTIIATVELAVSRPVRLLAQASRKLAARDFGAPLPKGGGEVGALAAGFATMRDEIRTYETDLLREIQERRQAEAGLRSSKELLEESEEKFRQMSTSAPDAIVMLDRRGAVVDWNPAAQRMFGFAREEMLGADFHRTAVPARYREAWEKGYRHFGATGEGPVLGKTIELMGLRRGSVEFPVELSVSAVRMKGQWHAIGIVRDITERKLAEGAREQLAAIVRSSRDAIIGKDRAGTITSWNAGAEKVYGYSAAEMIGRPVSALAPPERRDEVRLLLDRLERGEAVEGYETERVRKDGTRFAVSLTLSPIRDELGTLTGISTIARDITELKRAERALRKFNRFLRTLSRCNETLIHATDEKTLLDDMCRVVVEEGGFRLAWVGYLEHDEARSVRPVAQAGERAAEYVSQLDISWDDTERGRGPTGAAAREGRIRISDEMADAASPAWRARAHEYGFRSSIALPLKSGEELIGVLNIYAGETGVFSEEEVQPLAELAADLAFGIATLRARQAHRRSGERLARSMEGTIRAIALTIEKRDPYTAGHQQRVAELASRIAAKMGLPQDKIDGIRFGGLIHDIGKIYVPSEILNRPGRLESYEYALIQTHPEVGYDIVKDVELPWPVAQMILQHHERLDGSGYPKALKGDGIILEARILAVADVVEAIASHRPYRPALGLAAGLDEIRARRGVLYDAEAVDACLKLAEGNGLAFLVERT